MKQVLRKLFFTHHRYFEVWNFFWLMSENGICEFTYLDVCNRFKLPKSTLSRIIAYQQNWNHPIEYTAIERTANGHKIVFFEDIKEEYQRPAKPIIVNTSIESSSPSLLVWLSHFYQKKGVIYPNLRSHANEAQSIMIKLENSLKLAGIIPPEGLPEEDVENLVHEFFEKIPEWWINNQPTLPAINKNFTNIINQIKNHGSNSKSDSYRKEFNDLNEDDYSKLANG